MENEVMIIKNPFSGDNFSEYSIEIIDKIKRIIRKGDI